MYAVRGGPRTRATNQPDGGACVVDGLRSITGKNTSIVAAADVDASQATRLTDALVEPSGTWEVLVAVFTTSPSSLAMG